MAETFHRLMNEREWSRYVVDLAAWSRWIHYHTHDSRHSPPGFPDLVLIRPPELVFAELKSERGKLTASQTYWLDALTKCGCEAYVWRPTDETQVRERLVRRHDTTTT
jgi:hypothetical protein